MPFCFAKKLIANGQWLKAKKQRLPEGSLCDYMKKCLFLHIALDICVWPLSLSARQLNFCGDSRAVGGVEFDMVVAFGREDQI